MTAKSDDGALELGSTTAAALIDAAWAARERSYSPFSRFAVGAAVAAASGRVFIGANIENSSYGLTVCAERVAVFAAVAAGEREIFAIAVVAESPAPVVPCGACLQVLAEFAPSRPGEGELPDLVPGDLQLFLSHAKGELVITTLAALLPHPFLLAP